MIAIHLQAQIRYQRPLAMTLVIRHPELSTGVADPLRMKPGFYMW
jgi:hypothetical protein